MEDIQDFLQRKGADRDAQGKPLIQGDGSVGLGGAEVVLAAGAEYLVKGQPFFLIEELLDEGLGVAVGVVI